MCSRAANYPLRSAQKPGYNLLMQSHTVKRLWLMIRKTYLLCLIMSAMACHSKEKSLFDNSGIEISEVEIGYLTKLSREIKVKKIFDYFIKTGYQKKFDYIYELYGEDEIFTLDEAFKIVPQSGDEFVYKDVRLVESYTYYGIPVEIYKVPNGPKRNYYLAITDVSIGRAYEFLLFDEKGNYLDKYHFSTRYSPKWKLYRYMEIQENFYCILTIVNGNHGRYLGFVTITNNKFKEVFQVTMAPDFESDSDGISEFGPMGEVLD